jgi:hypothetical protein
MNSGLSHRKLVRALCWAISRSFIQYLHSSAKIPFMSQVKIHDISASRKSNEKNRRANARYKLNKVMEYRTVGDDTDWRFGCALNMSGRGILIEVPERLPIGSSLEISMDWTGLSWGRENEAAAHRDSSPPGRQPHSAANHRPQIPLRQSGVELRPSNSIRA